MKSDPSPGEVQGHDALDRRTLKVVLWCLTAAVVAWPLIGWRSGSWSLGFAMSGVCVALMGVVALIYRFRRTLSRILEVAFGLLFVGIGIWLIGGFLFSSAPDMVEARHTALWAPVAAIGVAWTRITGWLDRLSRTDWLLFLVLYALFHIGRAIDRLGSQLENVTYLINGHNDDNV